MACNIRNVSDEFGTLLEESFANLLQDIDPESISSQYLSGLVERHGILHFQLSETLRSSQVEVSEATESMDELIHPCSDSEKKC